MLSGMRRFFDHGHLHVKLLLGWGTTSFELRVVPSKMKDFFKHVSSNVKLLPRLWATSFEFRMLSKMCLFFLTVMVIGQEWTMIRTMIRTMIASAHGIHQGGDHQDDAM